MRLFLGIELTSEVKNHLLNIQHRLKPYFYSGRLVPLERLHMTLFFFGEVNDGQFHDLEDLLNDFDTSSFDLNFTNLDFFMKRSGNVSYCGVEKNQALLEVYEALSNRLKESKIEFDQKRFNPHITLVRQVKLKHDVDIILPHVSIEPMPVKHLTLFQSHQVANQLTYTPLLKIDLD